MVLDVSSKFRRGVGPTAEGGFAGPRPRRAASGQASGRVAATPRLPHLESLDQVAATFEPARRWPPVGWVTDETERLELFIHVAGNAPRDSVIRVDFEGGSQPPVFVGVDMMSVILTRIEPATHVLGYTVGRQDANYLPGDEAGWTPLGPKRTMALDAVLSDDAIAEHRRAPPPTAFQQSSPPAPAYPAAPKVSRLVAASAEHPLRPASPRLLASAEYPGRSRGAAATHLCIHVAAAASPATRLCGCPPRPFLPGTAPSRSAS